MKPESSQVKLPPDAVLKLYAELGHQAFFGLLGWDRIRNSGSGNYILVDALTEPKFSRAETIKLAEKYGFKLACPSERQVENLWQAGIIYDKSRS